MSHHSSAVALLHGVDKHGVDKQTAATEQENNLSASANRRSTGRTVEVERVAGVADGILITASRDYWLASTSRGKPLTSAKHSLRVEHDTGAFPTKPVVIRKNGG